MNIAHLSRFSEVATRYRGFIIDLWGVIHDGVTPFAGAVACLRQLRATGSKVVLLSNAPRRAAAAEAGLSRMGISRDLFDGIVTSGEATWLALADYAGARVLHLGPERDRSVVQDRDLVLVDAASQADLLLNTGPDDQRGPTSIEPYLPCLEACLAAGLPMLCANPDLEIVSGGRRLICAGALAEWYAQQGGRVRSIGKPHPEVYELVWPMLEGIDRREVLAVGDALRTDIAGARAAGIDSCWVLGGIHALEAPAEADAEAGAAGLRPIATLPALCW